MIWLSHTGLGALERCPRWFWLLFRRGLRHPEGIVSHLPSRFDSVLKNYFNTFWGTGELPPLVVGKKKSILQNPIEEIWFVTTNDRYGFLGKLDECLVIESGELVPVDFRSPSADQRCKEILRAY